MELSTIIGIAAGVIAVIGAMIFKGIDFKVLINPPAFLIIGLGTVATILNSYTGKELKNIGKLFKILFTTGGSNAKGAGKIIKEIMDLSMEARREGILSIEAKLPSIDDPFLRKGLTMIIDGASDEYILDVLMAEIEAMEERHAANAGIFSSAGTYAPTLGVLGAVFGLIAAMSHIEETDAMSEAIAAAFIATILGIFTGYVLWNPFAMKLRMKSKHEVLEKKMIVEGLLSLQKGESSLMVKDKLLAMLPMSQQVQINAELGQEQS